MVLLFPGRNLLSSVLSILNLEGQYILPQTPFKRVGDNAPAPPPESYKIHRGKVLSYLLALPEQNSL